MRSRNINHTPRVSTDNSANLPRVRAKSSQVNLSLCSQVCIRLLAKLIFTPLHSLPCLLSCALPLLLSHSVSLPLSLSRSLCRSVDDRFVFGFLSMRRRSLSLTHCTARRFSLSLALLVLTRFSHIIREVVAEAV